MKLHETNTYTYPAIFHREDDAVWVEFPDLAGCQTYGSSEKEAAHCAKEALSLFIETLTDENEPLPPPSALPVDMTDKNSFAAMVRCSVKIRHSLKLSKTNIPRYRAPQPAL